MDSPYAIGAQHGDPSAVEQVTDVPALKQWMNSAIASYQREYGTYDSQDVKGRHYTASSVRFDSAAGLVQKGSAPSYFGGLWSLTSCKKVMRGAPRNGTPDSDHNFRQAFRKASAFEGYVPEQPMFVVTCASRARKHDRPPWADERRNWVASIALVTHGFDGMDDYERYIRANHDGKAYDYRVTQRSDAPSIARKKGDCHVDDDGSVRLPPEEHDHGKSREAACDCSGSSTESADPLDHPDNSRAHLKCLSEPGYWLAWSQPRFAAKDPRNQGHANLDGLDTIVEEFEAVR